MPRRPFLFILLLLALTRCGGQEPSSTLIGAYRTEDGSLFAIVRGAETTLRVREYATGWAGKMFPEGESFRVEGSFEDPRRATARFSGNALQWTENGRTRIATRVPLPVVEAQIPAGDGTLLNALLILPVSPRPAPAVVLVHGSGKDPATEFYYNGWFLAANGIATLVYDKRGSGRSGGTFTANFEILASDAAAAVRWLQTRPEIDPRRVGLTGYSQGGWVAPLAATKAPAAFVVVQYGMIESPEVEENVQTLMTLRERGLSERDLAEAGELVRAATRVVMASFRGGWDEFDAVAGKYRDRPWMNKLDDTTAGAFLKYPHWVARRLGPRFAQPGLDWTYDGRRTLDRLRVPVAWILAGRDISAPNEATLAEIRRRGDELVLYPNADHGILRFELRNGQRVHLGFEPDYFRKEVEVVQRLAR